MWFQWICTIPKLYKRNFAKISKIKGVFSVFFIVYLEIIDERRFFWIKREKMAKHSINSLFLLKGISSRSEVNQKFLGRSIWNTYRNESINMLHFHTNFVFHFFKSQTCHMVPSGKTHKFLTEQSNTCIELD